MDALPLELLHLICSYLSHRDAASFRQVNCAFAKVAAHYLVSKIRFHTSATSFERLTALADHPVFRETIREVSYEGGIIADIGCHHAYINHFVDEPHHRAERPFPPAENASGRERRLYKRNVDKFNETMKERYAVYREAYLEQQALLAPDRLAELISSNLAKFTHLEFIKYSPARQCSHVASQRFESEFGRSCAIPISTDPKHSALQVERLLLHGSKIHPMLRNLDLEQVSPSLFTNIPLKVLRSVFKPLQSILLSLKVSSKDLREDADTEQTIAYHLSNDALKSALSAATNLEEFAFGIHALEPCSIHLNSFMDLDHSWPKLEELTLESVTSTEDGFIGLLRRQPKLHHVSISHFDLVEGSWIGAIDRLMKDFELKWFDPLGFLQDNVDLYPMDLLSETLFQDAEELTLGEALNRYVLKDSLDDDLNRRGNINPLKYIDEEFMSKEDLENKYGKTVSEMGMSDTISSSELDALGWVSDGPEFLDEVDSSEADEDDLEEAID